MVSADTATINTQVQGIALTHGTVSFGEGFGVVIIALHEYSTDSLHEDTSPHELSDRWLPRHHRSRMAALMSLLSSFYVRESRIHPNLRLATIPDR
jgi:hypothetical protein